MPFTESHHTVPVENVIVLLDLQTWIAGFDGSSVVLQSFPPILIDQSRWPLWDLSWIFTVPLATDPHSDPFPLTLSVPLPFSADNDPQFEPQVCASRAGAPSATWGSVSPARRQTPRIANLRICSLSAETPIPSRTGL